MATNSTTYYNLPVFAATDQPKWLVDWNTTMNVIDGAIAQAKAAGDNAQTTADANALAISGLSDSVSTISTALGTLTTNVTTLTGNVQRINELIGNGTPTTQDKTIIGAINELKAAIDALAPGGEVSAAEVSYDNTSSQLVADDVQDAIDELNTKIEAISPGGAYDFNLNSNVVATLTPVGGTIDPDWSEVNVLTNADGSIGKIYGGLYMSGATINTGTTDWVNVFTISASNLPTISEAYNINVGYNTTTLNNAAGYSPTRLHFNTDGTITVQCKIESSKTLSGGYFNLQPCLYFLKDLGD